MVEFPWLTHRGHSWHVHRWGSLAAEVETSEGVVPWCSWRFNGKSLWASSHIWNLAGNLHLNVTRSSQNEWRVLLMVFLLLFAHKPSFTRNQGNTYEKVLLPGVSVRWQKKTSPCRNRCDEAAKVKALKKLKDGPGSEPTAGDQVKMRRRKKSYREDPENVKEKNEPGWWFQTFFIFTPIWGRFPIWLMFFKWVETTN